MGKQYSIKHEAPFDHHSSTGHDKHRGFVWGLLQALNYHHWRPNRRKMIKDHQKQSNHTSPKRDEVMEVQNLLEEKENPLPSNRRPRSRKKRSLRARIKALIVGEKLPSKPDLRRTYSIHHLGDSEGGGLGKKRIILLPDSNKEIPSARKSDFMEIFKVDKGLLIKHLQDDDEALANFSAKFGKSRSFPAQRRKLRPVKLEDKKIEVWSKFSKEEDKLVQGPAENLAGLCNNDNIKSTHMRSSSLKESLDKYTNLYQKSFSNGPELGKSKSLRLGGREPENHVPTYFRRLRSTSSIDSYYSLVNFEVIRDEFSKKIEEEEDAAMNEANSLQNSNEGVNELFITEGVVRTPHEEEEDDDEDGVEKAKTSDNSDMSHDKDLQIITEGFVHVSNESIVSQEADNKESLTKDDKNSDLSYTRQLLDRSGIALDSQERTWHSYDQPLSPRLHEELLEDHYYPRREKDFPEDFYWHHQMLFDLVNEKLVEIYDVSLPYYPKALSKNCRVRPFPRGDRIVEEVLKGVGSLMGDREERTLDRVVARDLENDCRWMNLQVECEVKALEVEDAIFEELVEEIICFLR